MNAIFLTFTLLSIALCFIFNPDALLPAMTQGAQKSVTLALSLTAVYAVWMGIFEIAKQSKLSDKFACILKKPLSRAFKNCSDKAQKLVYLNVSANVLGLGGVATPLGIEACTLLEKENKQDKAHLLFIISATSVQILPTSVMSLLTAYGNKNPSAIILPTILATTFSTFVAIVLYCVFYKKSK